MAKRSALVDLAINDRRKGKPIFEWLYDELRSAILDGRLKRGVRLPSTRELAVRYCVARGTVVTVFEQLHAEGYLEGKVGAGTFVNTMLPEDLINVKAKSAWMRRPELDAPVKARIELSRYGERLGAPPPGMVQPARAFRPLEPALDEFPIGLWAQIIARRMRRASRTLLADNDSRGYRPLREAVASYLGVARGVRCEPDQVVIVSGIQHGLDLTARLMLDPGDRVLVEDPCHPIVVAMLKALGATIVPVPVDSHGINIVAAQRESARARLIYVTPAHQFPLGVTMSAERRLALLAVARRTGAVIFEDDYNSEYRYRGRPIPALQGLNGGDSAVVFAGSFSKVLLPSLRLGYLVVPAELVNKFAAARFVSDRHSSIIDQAAMCDFINQGHFGRHIRRMRELYASRLSVLRDLVREQLHGVLDLEETEAGLHTVGWLGTSLSAEAAAREAVAHKLELFPISRFALKSATREGLLMGFAGIDTKEIRRGVDRLAVVLDHSSSRAKRQSQ